MIIDISAVPRDGLHTFEIKGFVDVPEVLCPGASRAPAELTFKGSMERKDGSQVRFQLVGVMTAAVYTRCALCLKDIELNITEEINEVFAREPEDIEQWPVVGNKADLTPALRSVLLTSLPSRALCYENEEFDINNFQ
jgi:uncharacterized metal-binding protein YceD (DUF177 family)